MLKGFFSALAVVIFSMAALGVANAADVSWGPHKAMSMHGEDVFVAFGMDEEDARSTAMFKCQKKYGTNGCLRGISVPDVAFGPNSGWVIVGIACHLNGRSRPFIGASERGAAYDVAFQKAVNAGWVVGGGENCHYVESL